MLDSSTTCSDCLTSTEVDWVHEYLELTGSDDFVAMIGQNAFNMPCHNANMNGKLQTVIRNNFPMLSIKHLRWMVPKECLQSHMFPAYISVHGETCVFNIERESRNRVNVFAQTGNGMCLNCVGCALAWWHMFDPECEHFTTSPLLSQLVSSLRKRRRDL